MGSIAPNSFYTPTEEISKIFEDVQATFRTDKTQPIEWRKEQLKQVWRMLDDHEADFQQVLFEDLGKPKLETQLFELTLVKNEILHFLKEMDSWLAPESVSVPEPFQYWQPTVHKQPKGTALIIAPWNYPITLTMLPLLGLIAAGCTGIIKPSEVAPKTAAKLAELFPKYLDQSAFRIVNGDKEAVGALLEHHFDHIVYTGNGSIARIVMTAAAKHLTPITLELGGKSPVVVSDKASLELAAKRIAWGKYWNAGQTCMCPDYALVQESVLPAFLEHMKKAVEESYGNQATTKMGHIINSNHWNRVTSLLSSTKGDIVLGGGSKESSLFIEPTIVTNISLGDSLLSSEIFGPILPVVTYKTLPEARKLMAEISETPLGLHMFTEDPAESKYMLENTRSGGMCINDVMGHVAVTSLPFGGFGQSGMGSYRGKASIDTFSHLKSVATVATSAEFEGMLEWRYASGDREEKFKFFKANMEPRLE